MAKHQYHGQRNGRFKRFRSKVMTEKEKRQGKQLTRAYAILEKEKHGSKSEGPKRSK